MSSVHLQDTKSTYITFLYTNNELSKREIKVAIPFTIASKIINSRNKFNQGSERHLKL